MLNQQEETNGHRKDMKNYLTRIFAFIVLFLALDYGISMVLEKGIEKFYGLDRHSDALFIGHSHLMLAVDKDMFEKETGYSVSKYTREGVTVADRRIMLEQYFRENPKKVRLIVYGVDPWLFSGEGLSANSYKLFYPFMDNTAIDEYIGKSAETPFDYLSHKYFRATRFNTLLINASIRGYLGNWSNLKIGKLDTLKLKQEIRRGDYRKVEFDEKNIENFRRSVDLMSRNADRVVLLNTPIAGALMSAVGRDGDKAMALIRSVADRYPNVTVIDLAPEYQDKAELFFDPIHMNPEGQKVITDRFSFMVKRMPDRLPR
jgi:hypothetical protein